MWLLLSSTEKKSYELVFSKVKELLPDPSPERIISDYQENLMETLKAIFKDSTVVCGSLVNFCEVSKILIYEKFEIIIYLCYLNLVNTFLIQM